MSRITESAALRINDISKNEPKIDLTTKLNAKKLALTVSDVGLDSKKNQQVENKRTQVQLQPPAQTAESLSRSEKQQLLEGADTLATCTGLSVDQWGSVVSGLASIVSKSADYLKCIDKTEENETINHASNDAISSANKTPVVDNITDIEKPQSSDHSFNMVLDTNADTLDLVEQDLLKTQNSQTKLAVATSKLCYDTAVDEGNQDISGAKDQLVGAVTGATMNLSLQAGAIVASNNALSKESESLSTNVSSANATNKFSEDQQIRSQSFGASEVEGTDDPKVTAEIFKSAPERRRSAEQKNLDHRVISNSSQRTLNRSRGVEAFGQVSSHTIESGTSVSAANKHKEALEDRANAEMMNQIASIYQKTVDKTSSDTRTIQQEMATILENDSSTIGYMNSKLG